MAYDYVTSTGIVVADTSTTLTEVQDEYKSAFGADLDLTASTPQGILIEAETLSRSGIANVIVQSVNQFNPNYAGGIFLDALCALSGITRIAATYTTVTATITGISGTLLPSGSLATTTTGDDFELLTATTIPISGTIDAVFQAVNAGAIPALSGTLTTIKTGVIGWETITNSANGVTGVNEQSDEDLRTFRNNTLSSQAVQTTEAIISALYQVDGVQSLTFRENTASTTQTIDTISMVAHSIWCCVNGGTDLVIAQCILDNKSAGSNFNGSVSVPVTAMSGQIIDVLFDRPIVVNMLVKITVKISNSYSVTSQQIAQQITDYANGVVDGELGFVVGGSVSPFELSSTVATIPGVYVKSCEIAPTSTSVYQSTEYPIAINEIAALTLSSVTVIII